MSFLVDPALLAADGEAYARLMPESAQGRLAGVAGALAVGTFWAVAAALWADHPAARPFRRAFGYRSGREFMLRYPLPDRGRKRRPQQTDEAIAIAALATYPLWWYLGWDHGRRRRASSA
jgi:hypothetical protein